MPFWYAASRMSDISGVWIVLTTLLDVVLVLALFPWGMGWYLSETLAATARQAVRLRHSHESVEESWRRYRQFQIDTTRPRLECQERRVPRGDQPGIADRSG